MERKKVPVLSFLARIAAEILLLKRQRKLQIGAKSRKQLQKIYSIFNITGRTNWVLTGMPRLSAGLIFGKSVSLKRNMLSSLLLPALEFFASCGSKVTVESGKTVTLTLIVSRFATRTAGVSTLSFS